jgi:glycosyltransferase involved in cell wall biosynthesis
MRPRANAVVAVALSQVDQLVRDGYHREAIRVIPSGVADNPPLADREALRAELGVGPDGFLAVLVAALRPEKRAALFVEQVSAAHAIDPSIHGLVLGDGPDAASVTSAVRRSGGAVRMLGYRADAVDLMHAGEVVCLTSAVEALPMSVLEAMSVGRPVIATRVGDLPEVVEDGRTGFLVSPDRLSEVAHALVALARDRTRAEELGRAGRARQQQAFSIEAMTRGYAELVADLDRHRRKRVRRPVARPVT